MNAVLLASFDRLTALLVFFKSAQCFKQTFSARFTLNVVLADSQMLVFVFFHFIFASIINFKSARFFWFSQWFYRFNLFVLVAVRLSLKNREAFHWILWLNSTSLWCREHHFSDFVAQSFQVDWFFLSILHFLQSALKLVRQEFNCSLFDIWL